MLDVGVSGPSSSVVMLELVMEVLTLERCVDSLTVDGITNFSSGFFWRPKILTFLPIKLGLFCSNVENESLR